MAFPGTYNFNYYRGDKFEFKVYPKNANGSSLDLTPYTSAVFKIANRRGSLGTQYTATATIVSSSGYINCTITPTVGRSLAAGTYVYDIELSDTGAGNIVTIITGTITVTDDISGAVS